MVFTTNIKFMREIGQKRTVLTGKTQGLPLDLTFFVKNI